MKGVQEIHTNCPFDANNNAGFTSCDVDFWSICGIEPPRVELQTKRDLDRIVDDFERKVIERLMRKYPAEAGAAEAIVSEPTWEPVEGDTADPSEVLFNEPQPRFSPEFQAEMNDEMEAYLRNFFSVVVPNSAWYGKADDDTYLNLPQLLNRLPASPSPKALFGTIQKVLAPAL